MEKKILIIPDVHGRSFWRSAVASGDYDKIIFLGDYVDPYPDERIGELTALHGLMDIIDFYDRHPDQVVLLLGNHDLHYLSPYYHEMCPCDRYDEKHSDVLHLLFTKGDRFNLAHEETIGSQKYLFTHAGVNQPWLKRNLKVIRKPDAIHLNRGTDRMASAPDIRFRHEPHRPHRLFRCILLFFFPRPCLPARAVHRPDSKRKKNQKHHKPAHAFRSPFFPVFRPAYAVRFYVLPETWYNPVGMTNHEPFKESDHGQKKPFHQVPDPQAHRE